MASDNARHFELRLRKLGLFMLICSMAGLLFASFLFGVVVGNDLETYPEKISRQMPVKFLEWTGLLKVGKAPPLAVVIKNEKAPAKEETGAGLIAQNVIPQSPPMTEADVVQGAAPSPKQEKATALLTPPMPRKGKTDKALVVTIKEKEPATDQYVVQVTSCKSRKIAEEVARKIGKMGYQARIVTADLKEKGIWYRVLLPNLDGKKKANEAAENIDRLLKGNKSVVHIQNR
jgi:cell division protein FtsN